MRFPNALFCPNKPSFLQIIIPFCIILTTLILTVCVISATAGQLVLREVCLDNNLPADCSDSLAVRIAAQYGTLSNGLPGLIALFTVGFWTALSNKLGRRCLITLSIFGFLCPAIAWYCIYNFKSIHSSWKPITIAGACIQALFGSGFILYLGVFAMVNDISVRHPEKRVYYYLGVDLLIAGCTVIATQLSTFFMARDPLIMCTLCCIGYITTITLLFFTLPESIDPELQNTSIQWKQINPFKQLQFALPSNQETILLLQQDVDKVYDKIVTIYKLQNPDWIEPEDPTSPIDYTYQKPLIHKSSQNESLLLPQGHVHPYSNVYGDEIISIPESYPLPTSILEDVHVLNDSGTFTMDNGCEIPRLDLPFPPRKVHHKNAMLVLLLSLTFNSFVNVAVSIIQFLYMKERFATTSKQFNNLNAIAVGAKTIISLLILPLFNKFITTARGEVKVLITTTLVEAGLYCLFPFAQSLWLYGILFSLSSVVAIFPTATVRSLMANQVSEELQKSVLATIVASQVMILLAASVTATLLWTFTARIFIGTVYLFAGILAVVAAVIVPLLLQDSKDELNLRVKMTTQYTLICHLEAEHQKKLDDEQVRVLSTSLDSLEVMNEQL